MASYQSLGEDLECPICLEYAKDPKVMGKCLHAACLNCLKKLVAAQSSSMSFPCPCCREECMIPSNGVAGLKDDFRLRALVEKYQKIKKSDKSLINCIACPNPACHLCKKCDKIYLCRDCSKRHSRNPLTAAHIIVGICSKHGKKLDVYCRQCNTAICCACSIADHPTDSHNVVPHQEVAEEVAAEVFEAVEKLNKTREQKEAALCNIIDIRDSFVAGINSELMELGKQSDYAIEYVVNKHLELEAESSNIQMHIAALVKRKDTVDRDIIEIKKQGTLLRQKKEGYSRYLNRYREERMSEFLVAMTHAAAETGEITANLELGRKESSLIRILDDQAVPSLVKVKEELAKTITAAEQVDRVAPFVDDNENMPLRWPIHEMHLFSKYKCAYSFQNA